MEKEQGIDRNFKVLLLISTIIFISYIMFQGKEYSRPIDEIKRLEFIGSYEVDGRIMNIKDFKRLGGGGTSKVILRGYFNQSIEENEEIFFFVTSLRMTIKQNGRIICRYGQKESNDKKIQSIGKDWVILKTDGISQNDYLEIILEPTYKSTYDERYKNFFSNIYAGSRYELIRGQISKGWPKILISAVLFIAGMIFLATMHALKFMKIPILKGYGICALLMMLGAICTTIDYSYIILVFNNSYIINIIDIVTQLLIGELVLMYLKGYLINPKSIYIGKYITLYGGGCILIYYVCHMCGIVSQLQILELTIPIWVIIVGSMLALLMLDYRRYADRRIKQVLVSGIILSLCTVIEMIYFWIEGRFCIIVFQIGLIIFTMMQFGVLLNYAKKSLEKSRRADELEVELAQNRIAITMSQIQPHFLYNSLTSIQELCLCDPQKAHSLLMKFSQFLRGNMDSLTTTKLIPFDKELQHVRNYLYLEKVRYEEYLQVFYEIEVSDFFIPALCIQPIVENAVRYGVGKKEEGGMIVIKTKETENAYEIIVEDDGVGFDITEVNKRQFQDFKRSHIGLENVNNRLKAQCKGKLEVQSQIGVGTKVIIWIPKERG